MPEFIDVMTTGAAGSFQTFTVNVAANEVAVTAAGAPPVGLCANGFGASKLQPLDNFRLLSVGVSLPYQFGLGDAPALVNVLLKDSAGGTFNYGDTWLPLENYELSLDIFQPYSGAYGLGGAFLQIWMKIAASTQISMLNAPAALNGNALPVFAWCKVLHNLPLL